MRIVAFEPAKATYTCLMRNLTAYIPGAIGHQYALGEAEGKAKFTYYPATPSQSGRYASREEDDRLTMDYLSQIGVARADAEFLIEDLHVEDVMTVPVHTVSNVIIEDGLDSGWTAWRCSRSMLSGLSWMC